MAGRVSRSIARIGGALIPQRGVVAHPLSWVIARTQRCDGARWSQAFARRDATTVPPDDRADHRPCHPRRHRRGATPGACGASSKESVASSSRVTPSSSRSSARPRSRFRRSLSCGLVLTSTTSWSRSRARHTWLGPSRLPRCGDYSRWRRPRRRSWSAVPSLRRSSTTAPASTRASSHSVAPTAGPPPGYRLRSHPCQQAMLGEVAAAAAVEQDAIVTGVDGCGVVTFALPLWRAAAMFGRLPSLDGGPRVVAAMRAHPGDAARAGRCRCAPDPVARRLGGQGGRRGPLLRLLAGRARARPQGGGRRLQGGAARRSRRCCGVWESTRPAWARHRSRTVAASVSERSRCA